MFPHLLQVIYSDGDSEELNLIEERWQLLEDHTSADEVLVSSFCFGESVIALLINDFPTIDQQDEEIDLPESIPLSDM